MASEAFRKLLWFAVEVDDDALERILKDEIPGLAVVGILESTVVAFVAYRQTGPRVVIEYIAVDGSRRGRGYGAHLIDSIKSAQLNTPIYAQTDDDAVAFYRACGFRIEPRASDPRWPERQRYDCTLGGA